MKKNILIVGASRGIGLETVKTALASGYRVRGFARGASAIHPRSYATWRVQCYAARMDDIRHCTENFGRSSWPAFRNLDWRVDVEVRRQPAIRRGT